MSNYSDEPLHRLEPAYLEHYGLDEPPFSALVDERFYFSTAESSQRMSLLVHMTQYSDMVLMVLGEEGMGKSTLLQAYIKSAHDNWHICRINANSMMDKDQLLFRIAEDFGLGFLPSDSAELQEMLYEKMTQLHQNDVLPVIIVDDAHELPTDAISQLFIMAEIKAGDITMVHIVLFAEPQIDKTINASNVRKIRERIGHNFELSPFDETDTAEYILNRMTHAGLQGENPFSQKVIRQIHKQSQGNPARINELAHSALDEAQGGNEPEYDDAHELDQKPDRLLTPLRIFVIFIIANLAGLGLWQQDRINQVFNGPQTNDAPIAKQDAEQTGAQRESQDNPFAQLKEKMIKLEANDPDIKAPNTLAPIDTQNLEQIEDPAIAAQLEASRQSLSSPVLKRIEPATLTASQEKQTLTLHGEGFTADTEVTLHWSGKKKTLPRSRIKLDSDTKIRIELTTGKKPDTWSIMVSDPTGKSTSAEFKVTSAQITPAQATPLPGSQAGSAMAEQWIQSQPAKNLTLQLLGSHSLKPIKKYIKQYKLADQAVVYKTTHENEDWYVLLYGSYTNQQQAQQTIEHLPKAARANKPWVRSFASIRRSNTKTIKKRPAPATDKVNIPALNNIKAHEAWLWGQDPSHYTLQLLGTHNIDNIKQFIQQHQLRGKVVYYHTQRDDQNWYALLYGAYPQNTDARAAVGQLPASLKKLSPWIRNFSAIHTEMDKPN